MAAGITSHTPSSHVIRNLVQPAHFVAHTTPASCWKVQSKLQRLERAIVVHHPYFLSLVCWLLFLSLFHSVFAQGRFKTIFPKCSESLLFSLHILFISPPISPISPLSLFSSPSLWVCVCVCWLYCPFWPKSTHPEVTLQPALLWTL